MTYVDDAATLTLETQALTEDAVSENTVVLSYEANDEDTETVTVAFTAGTNTEGYYQLDTENNQVTLTSKGATALNEGKSLGEVSLTASSGDPVKTTTASVEPNVTYVNDGPEAQDFVLSMSGNESTVSFDFDEQASASDPSSMIDVVSDEEDDVSDSDGKDTQIKFDAMPVLGDVYLIEGDNRTLVTESKELTDSSSLEYELRDDVNAFLSFDAVDDFKGKGENNANSPFTLGSGVVITGGSFTGDRPDENSTLTTGTLTYEGADRETGLGVSGTSNEVDVIGKEYIGINFDNVGGSGNVDVVVKEANLQLGSLYSHYQAGETPNAQIHVLLMKDGQLVQELTYDDDDDPGSVYNGTNELEINLTHATGFDEVRVFVTQDGASNPTINSNFTFQGLDIVDAQVTESLNYTAKDSDHATDGGVIQVQVGSTHNATNDAPTINTVVNGSVSEEGLTDGNIDNQGSGDTTNSKVFTGSFNVADSDSDNLNVSISGPAGVTSGGETITWSWDADNQTLTGSTPSASVIQIVLTAPASNSDVGEWTYTATLLAPIDHSDTSTEDVLDLDINLLVSDGQFDAQSIITIKVEDDSPDSVNIDAVNASVIDIPDVLTGKISFKGSHFSGNQLEKDGVVVTAVGFLNNESAETGAVNVTQSSQGLGVASPGNLGYPLSNEVDFRYAGDQGVSEQLVINLDGKVAYGATIEFDHLYGGEKEEGVAHFYRDGELIASQSFSSDASSGDYARHFSVQEGGFDKVILEATSNGNDHTKADNSDFTVASITFTDATSDVAIAHVEGTLQGDFGADGAGSLRLTGAESGLQTKDGSNITVSVQAQNPNRVSGYDEDGNLVFDVHFTPATGAWEFMQYKTMLSPQGDGDIDFSFEVLDGDGDSATGTFAVNPYIPPSITVTANNFVEDSGTTSVGDPAATFTYTVNSTSNSEITFASDSNLNQHYQIDVANNEVILTDKGLAAINKGEPLDKINLIVTEHIGSDVESSSASATPQVTPVDDAPEITVTAKDFTEDAANVVEGATAATFVTSDEDGDTVKVSFTTISAHYTLDESNGRVLLTEAGVAAVNAGEQLDKIELTATANGVATPATAQPKVTAVNDGPEAQDFVLNMTGNESTVSFDFDQQASASDPSSIIDVVTDEEDDASNSDGKDTQIKFDAMPVLGDVYLIEGDNRTLVTESKELTDSSSLEYELRDDVNAFLSFDAVDDFKGQGEGNANSPFTLGSGVVITGGSFTGDRPDENSTLTTGTLTYEGADRETGLGVAGNTNEVDVVGKEYIGINFDNVGGSGNVDVVVKEANLQLGSLYSHYQAGHASNAQIHVLLMKDGQLVQELTYDDDDNPGSVFNGTNELEINLTHATGFDEVRVFVTEDGDSDPTRNSNLTVQGLDIVDARVTEKLNYTATDSDDATDGGVIQVQVGSTHDATNTAPTITLKANDLTEDSGLIVGSPAATYSVTDAQNDAITVDFKEGTNTNGHYTLNTATNTVVLTQEGLDLVNDGLALDTIELVAKENDSSLFGSASATPNIIQTNDAPTIENVTTGSISEEGLASGIQDDLGSPDTTNDTSVNGSFVISDVDSDSLTVSLTGPDGLTSGGESITWSWNAVDNKLTGSTSTGTVMEITVTEPNDNGKGTWDYTATLLKPLDHQNDTSEDALSVNLGIVASDGSIETITPLVISVEDDALVVTDKAAVDFTLNNLPDVVTGQVSFRGNSGSSNTAQLLADKGIIVTALGFTSYESNVLGAADVNQSQHGIGVHSSASLGFPLSNEVDYRFANNSDGKPGLSEELIIDLQGKVAFGAAIEFDKMFSNEPENGVATFYRNGVEVFEQTFSSDKTSGDYAKNFDVHEGGFDKIVLKATGNGNTASQQDNSDFTVASITFPDPSDKTMIARAEGTLQIEYGADGFGSVGNLDLVEAETGLKTANGHDVVVSVNANDKNSLVGRDTNGQLVFEVHLTPTTGQWEFFQYESMLVPQGDNDIDFTFVATDGDGDKVTGVFSVNPFTRPVINVDGKVLIEDDGVAEGTVAASYSTHYENSEVTVTITEGTDPNAYYTLDSVNQTVKLTEAGAAEVNAGNNLPPVSLTVVHNSANTSLVGIGTDTPEVTQVNDAPVLEEITFAASGKEDEVIQLNLSELNITDEEGDSSFISDITVDPQFGEITLTRDSSNKVTGAEFKPAADRHFIGDNNVPFEVTVSDGDKQSTATVGLNVEAQVDRAVVTATMSDSPEVNSSITKYPVDINIELLDRDGSERIETVTISGLYHSTLFADGVLIGTADQHGNITIPGNVWDNDAQLYIKILNEYDGVAQDTKPDITVTATIIEQSTGEQQTSSDTISLDEVIGHETTEGSFNNNLGDANDIVVGDLQGAVVTPGTNHNVAFMIDTSGSISSGDMAEIQKQMKQVVQELKDSASSEHAGEVNVFIADFDNPTHTLASVNLKDDDAVEDLYDMIDKMSAWGGTNYEDVFKTTANWFESDQAKSNTDAINMAYFVTDDYATAYNDEFTHQEVNNWFVQDKDTHQWKRMSEVLDELKEKGSISEQLIFSANDNIPGISDNGNSADSRDVLIHTDGRIYIQGVTGGWRYTPYHVRPDGDGGFEVVDLIGGSSVDNIDYQQATDAFNQHLKSEVIVEAIGIGDGVTSNYLEQLDTDSNVASQINVTELADTIMGKVNTLAVTSDTIRGNDVDDILFGDSIRLPGTTEQGYDAIESYVAGKLGVDSVSDAQVGHYIREHASEFEYSNSEHKDDFLAGRKGSDVLFGQGGDDQLHGGKGNDMLIGGLGDDILTGGEGSDLFKWIDVEHGATDVIKDFDLEHGDRIDLSDIFDGLDDTEVDDLLEKIESSASVNSEGHATITVEKGSSSMTIEFENITSSSELTDYLFNQHGLKYNDY